MSTVNKPYAEGWGADMHLLHGLEAEQLKYFIAFMLRDREHTLLPEFLEVFEPKDFLKFLETFAGVTFRVPDVDQVRRIVMLAMVYVGFTVEKKSRKILRDRFGLTQSELDALLAQAKSYAEELGFET